MTDTAANAGQAKRSVVDRKPDLSRARVRRRYGAEARFKAIGLGAILVAVAILAALLTTIVSQGLPAFVQHDLDLDIYLDPDEIDPANLQAANYQALVRQTLYARFPEVTDRRSKRKLAALVSSGADLSVKRFVEADPQLIGTTQTIRIPASDDVDTFLKGQMTDIVELQPEATLTPSGVSGDIELVASADVFATLLSDMKEVLTAEAERILAGARRERRGVEGLEADLADLRNASAQALGPEREAIEDRIAALEAQLDQRLATVTATEAEAARLLDIAASSGSTVTLTDQMPSLFAEIGGGQVKIATLSPDRMRGGVVRPLESAAPADAGQWQVVHYTVAESNRRVKDDEAAWLRDLGADGVVASRFATAMFTSGDSREPELAGIWGAVVGSFLTLMVTLILSFPVGVLAAIYLEEFAPRNRWTDLIEVNINNLAAVPSIVFGLLGLAVFLNFFGLPRSAPLVGGMVLALMTLPTIIIATRAALKAVPPSIREAALGVGASRVQVITHHVLPLAMPGILTGTIIGMAQALGETAPLLMIGMVAFIVDIPGGFTDPATVLPVQIYIWADSPERAFVAKTSAAIMVLLTFLVMMNALAVLLRRRFERRW